MEFMRTSATVPEEFIGPKPDGEQKQDESSCMDLTDKPGDKNFDLLG